MDEPVINNNSSLNFFKFFMLSIMGATFIKFGPRAPAL